MCSLIQLCPHQTVTCSKCLQMFSSCVRGCHYDFVVNDTWKVSFKNSSGPLKLQVLGGEVECRLSVHSLLCQLSPCKTRAALTCDEQDVGAKSLLGHWQPLQSYFQTTPWEKKRSPNCLFPTSICFNIEAACAMGYMRVCYTGTWHWLETTQEQKEKTSMFSVLGKAGMWQ